MAKSDASAAPVAEGDVVLDKYRVERVLGQGGMGVVVAATHVDLDQKVALKFLLPSALAHADIVERFAREAKAAAKIQSQHVVRVLDTGRMPSGAPFMVMEYLEGEDLGHVLKRTGPLATNVVADYLLQACEAIGEAHAAGIVHRDLKPANLFLAKQRDRRSIVKVLDFGISKLEDPKVDARSDIWSLGVILYELIAGKRPFEGDTMPEVVGQVLNNEPARLSTLKEGVSIDLELVVARCLASSTKDRFQSVADLARALAPFTTDASAASASVARISRVLGAASIPPSGKAPASSGAVVLLVDQAKTKTTMKEDAAVATTVRPAKPKAEPEADLALAGTTPATDLSGSLPLVAKAEPERPPHRRLVIAIGAAAMCVIAFVGLRGSSDGSTNERRSPSTTPSTTASSVATSDPIPPASSVPPPTSSSSLAPSASASAIASASAAPPKPSPPTSKPTPRASASARKDPPKNPFDMDIK